MNKIILVGAGGGIGAVLRYIISGSVHKWIPIENFPHGTLTVNLAGCLLIGMLLRMDEVGNILSTEIRLFLLVGILGAFTTFSTFSNETVTLMNDRRLYFAILNIGLHFIFGLGAVLLGRGLICFIWK